MVNERAYMRRDAGCDIHDHREGWILVRNAPPGKLIEVGGLDSIYMTVWNRSGKALVDVQDGFTVPLKDFADEPCRVLKATLTITD